eukprot:CAMPEP_0170358914 /NCGR_PEP_ID=MMETSP0117_2-20130122/2474_1 /TAXON_ID=400756 /ORGANISM="Durinskia baltica, Strain CSIRO CS-38" /LENGTH=148 /DNA_ID=CAMNT_0010613139 /DNA_START=54 /DNA_END=500 /DNA_ORIENTATION=+
MIKTVAGKRFFSAAAANPKIAIAQNIMLLKEIANAADEAALDKIAASGASAIDASALPKDLEHLESYFKLTDLKATGNFTPDSKAWQNMGAWDFAGTEMQRSETWPFVVGVVSVLVFIGGGIGMALPKGEARENSKYLQMLEGRAHHH